MIVIKNDFILFKEQQTLQTPRLGLFDHVFMGQDSLSTSTLQNNKTEGVKQKRCTIMYQDTQEKILSLSSKKCDTFITDDVTNDTEIGSDESSIYSEGSSVSALTDGTSKSDTFQAIVWARSYLHAKENIIDRIPIDMNNKKNCVLDSFSMIVQFVQYRRKCMAYVHNDNCDNNELSDLFRWGARKYPRENASNVITSDDIESIDSNWSPIIPIKVWKHREKYNRRLKSTFQKRVSI